MMGPSRVSDSSVSAETVIYEAFVSMGLLGFYGASLHYYHGGNLKCREA